MHLPQHDPIPRTCTLSKQYNYTHTHIYIYTYIHIHPYIYIYIERERVEGLGSIFLRVGLSSTTSVTFPLAGSVSLRICITLMTASN